VQPARSNKQVVISRVGIAHQSLLVGGAHPTIDFQPANQFAGSKLKSAQADW